MAEAEAEAGPAELPDPELAARLEDVSKTDEYASNVKFLKILIPRNGDTTEHINKIFPYLYQVYKRNLPKAEVKFWYNRLEKLESSVDKVSDADKEVSPELRNVIRIKNALAQDPQLPVYKLERLAEGLKNILRDDLYKQVIYSQVVPQELADDQKYDRKNFCRDMKTVFYNNGENAEKSNYIVFCVEMHLNYVEPKSEAKAKAEEEESEAGPSARTKKLRPNTPIIGDQDDTMLVVFFNCSGVLHHEFIQQSDLKTKYPKMLETMSKNIAPNHKDGDRSWFLHNDTTLLRVTEMRQIFLNKNLMLITLPWVSPDLSPYRFLYGKLETELTTQYNDKDYMEGVLKNKVEAITGEECARFIKTDLFNYFKECENNNGNYTCRFPDYEIPAEPVSLSKFIIPH